MNSENGEVLSITNKEGNITLIKYVIKLQIFVSFSKLSLTFFFFYTVFFIILELRKQYFVYVDVFLTLLSETLEAREKAVPTLFLMVGRGSPDCWG